jgi:hypothetical protein
MKGLSKEQWIAAVLAVGLTVGGLGTLVKMQGDLGKSAKEGKAKRAADIEAINSPDAAKPQH